MQSIPAFVHCTEELPLQVGFTGTCASVVCLVSCVLLSFVQPTAQMTQAKLFENQNTFWRGKRTYGSSQHYHFAWPNHPDQNISYGGARRVESTMTDMLATVSKWHASLVLPPRPNPPVKGSTQLAMPMGMSFSITTLARFGTYLWNSNGGV